MTSITLSFPGGSQQMDSLYSACSLYMLKQAKIVKHAVLTEERDLALVRIEHIQSILKQIESL